MPVLRIGFYRVDVNSREEVTFADLLAIGRGLPDDETRTLDRPDGPVRLQFARQSADAWQGELIRIRLGEDPKKANRRGRVMPIDFEEDEGLGEETAFVYDPQLRIIAYHEHRGGVTLGNAARYFKTISRGRVRSIQFKPIVRPDALARILGMGRVREFEIDIAGPDSGAPVRDLGHSALTLFQAKNEFQALKARFRFTLGRGAGTLQNVKEAITQIWNRGDELKGQVDKLTVTGEDEAGDEQLEIIDLIEDRLVVPVTVDLRNGRLTDTRRRAAVLEAWSAQRESLLEAYGET